MTLAQPLKTFLREAASRAEGAGLPRFVEDEFRTFLTCGVSAHGFARLRCGGCGFERLVPFSCKGRGFCPSCGGRRMTERAARLVAEVVPRVPVRQWVLSLPHRCWACMFGCSSTSTAAAPASSASGEPRRSKAGVRRCAAG